MRFRPAYILGYSSALHTLASGMLAAGLPPPDLKVVISDSEPLLDYQRQTVARAFRCPVIETYGQTEGVLMASECFQGRMHLWPEAGYLEVLANGAAVPAGEIGDFVATGLNNPDMPFIRYRLGDCGSVSGGQGACSCGRRLPQLAAIVGRIDDIVVTADGRQISGLDPAFHSDGPLIEAQVVQESLDLLRVRCVVGPGWLTKHEDAVAEGIRDRVGSVRVEFERVDRIARGPNNKFKFVTSKLSREDRARALRCETTRVC